MNKALIIACLDLATVALAVAIGCAAWRIARGPTLLDRILAFDVLTVSATALLVVQSIRWETGDYVELILLYTVLGFSTSVAFVAYLSRSDEPRAAARGKVQGKEKNGN